MERLKLSWGYERCRTREEAKARKQRVVEELSIRSRNCLIFLGCDYLEDAVKLTERELLRQPNLGKGSVREITEKLAQRGLRLAGPEPEPREVTLSRLVGKVNQTKAAYEAASQRLCQFMAEQGD